MTKNGVVNCNYDAVGEMLKHIMPNQDKQPLVERDMDWQTKGTLSTFDQSEFVSPSDWQVSSFDDQGYVYIPNSCSSTQCRVHLVTHGCSGGASFIGTGFIENAGYLEWAATNDIVVLFPQIKASDTHFIYKGCWDFFGYTGADYAIE